MLVNNRSGATEAHINGLKADIGQVRFRVLEVAGAVAADAYPANFETADMLGEKLKEMIGPA